MKRLLLIGGLMIGLAPIVFGFSLSKTVDLDGDGRPDTIGLEIHEETDSYILTVNGHIAKGTLEFVDGFKIIDIDTSDRRKEIAVHSPGPSDDDVYIIYDYDGKSLKRMATLSRWPVFLGNGVVYVDNWMGFWTIRRKYQLDSKKRQLNCVPQEFYYVGVEATVRRSFPILQRRDDRSAVVAKLKPNSKVMILLCDPSPKAYGDDWYLIKSESGLVGWTKEKGFTEKFHQLPYAD